MWSATSLLGGKLQQRIYTKALLCLHMAPSQRSFARGWPPKHGRHADPHVSILTKAIFTLVFKLIYECAYILTKRIELVARLDMTASRIGAADKRGGGVAHIYTEKSLLSALYRVNNITDWVVMLATKLRAIEC